MIGRKGWVIGLVLGLEGLLGSREPAWAQAQPDAPADAGITVTTAPAGETVPRTEYDQLRRDMQRMQQRLDAVEGQQAVASIHIENSGDWRLEAGDWLTGLDL